MSGNCNCATTFVATHLLPKLKMHRKEINIPFKKIRKNPYKAFPCRFNLLVRDAVLHFLLAKRFQIYCPKYGS